MIVGILKLALHQSPDKLVSADVIPEAYSPHDVVQHAFGNHFMRRNGDGVFTKSSNLFQTYMAALLPYPFVAQGLEETYSCVTANLR